MTNFFTHRSATVAALAICAATLAAAPPARAVDGVILITQATASAGLPGCAPTLNYAVTICTSGSYRLAGNFSPAVNGIKITANDVTLDLNGFALTGTGFYGVFGDGNEITVRNGKVVGFLTGVNLVGAGEQAEELAVNGAGVAIQVGSGTIANCIADNGSDTSEGLVLTNDGLVIDNTVSGYGFGIVLGGNDQVKGNQVTSDLLGVDEAIVVQSTANVSLMQNQLAGGNATMQIAGSLGYGLNVINPPPYPGSPIAATIGTGSATSMGNNICLGRGPC